LVSVSWLREKPESVILAAAAPAVAGAYVLASCKQSQHEHSSLLGVLAALGAGVSWGVADTAMAKCCLTHSMPRATLHLVYMLSAETCWGIFATLRGKFGRKCYPWHGVKIALLTAFTGMFAGMFLWFIALERTPVRVLSPTRGALTLFVFILSVLVLREKPSRRSGLGVALVAAGIAIVSLPA
jgi:drug/metabolite transporter (DMT)-like permease